MPFGLCNAPETFQGYINKSLQEYLDVFCMAYLDDMLIYTRKGKNHASHVFQMLKRLHKHELQVDIDKCEFNTTKVKYLGIIMTTNSIEIDTEKVKAIQKRKAPLSMKDVQAFLGFVHFYCCFIPKFSKKVKPLNELTKDTQYTTKECQKSQVWCFPLEQDMSTGLQRFEACFHYCTSVSILWFIARNLD